MAASRIVESRMTESRTTKFLSAARTIGQAAALLGLVAPGFRTPPRVLGANRTIRRAVDGEGGVVSVRVAGRPFIAVVGDMIEGVVVLNRLDAATADGIRTELWRSMEEFASDPLPTGDEPGVGGAADSMVA